MRETSILMVGAGRMAEAVLSGLVKDRHPSLKKITMTNRSDRERLHELEKKYGTAVSDDWTAEVSGHDVIFLAAPPGVHGSLLRELAEKVDRQLVITVAAGIDAAYMEERLPEGTPVCWIMPNTAAQIGKSISTYTCGRYVTEENREVINLILEAIGASEELTEQQVHDLTAVTGSAPAFVYAFVEAMEEAAVENGVTPEQARELVVKMLSGSAAMLEAGYAPDDLRKQVASPGGSTAAGLEVLKERNYHETIKAAVKATNAHARSQG
ncbi:pyrroline-5-carboxylate reductase [Alteribacter natronophilus]|uniref:pyrroline-5-carboxylate reductase n=1 Tax=Alteribacter natronophilus TaxID=2583810 RepID=UPI00110D986D|nr:pyrroline-5-carboxylate reductase [Alteribacter natronophilus]TMW71791.1 pyrroline-5-carboxylate reductase [Alteribacter natronophilus]